MITNQTMKQKVIKRSKKDNFMLWEHSTKDNISGYNCYYVLTDYKGIYINSFPTFKMAEKEIENRTKRSYLVDKKHILEQFEHYLKFNSVDKNYVNRFDVNNFIAEIKNAQKKLTIKDVDTIENIIYENYYVNCKDLWEVVYEDVELEKDFENSLVEIYDNANDKEALQLAITLLKHATMRLDSDLDNLKISKEYARLYNICWQLQEIIDNYV
ncbi:MAG: hypothetical protein J6T10_32305 [Methanobrevibacter sp.]|nr:hypothetical protein [Methanobrevibacter sp.]